MNQLKRWTALVLICCLMVPVFSLGEGALPVIPGTVAHQYNLSFHMDADAFPETDEPETLQGMADLINILSVQGETVTYDISFDTKFDLLLNQEEDTRTHFHIFGLDSHWMAESPLLGNERVFFNQLALLEFAMKGYFHLGLPLQLPALLSSPFVHASAARSTWQTIQDALGERTEVTLSRDQLLTLATTLSDSTVNDRALSYWIKTMFLDAGYDELVEGWLRTLPQWVGSWGAEGLTVARTADTEKWTAGGHTLFMRTTSDTETSWTLHLPPMPDGNQVEILYRLEKGESAQQLHLRITVGTEEERLLQALVTGENLPLGMAIHQPGKLDILLEGPMAGSWAGQHQLLLDGDGSQATIQWMNTEKNLPMVWAEGTITKAEPTFTPFYPPGEVTGVDLLSVNDESLKDFVESVTRPMMEGMLPLLLQVPASAYQAVYQLLEDYGILSLMTAGLEGDS